MEKLVRVLGKLLGALTVAIHKGGGQVPGTDGAVAEDGVNRETLATILGLFYVSIVGIVDLMTTRGMNFDLFYLFGCACVGWAVGTRPALLLTVAAGAFLYFDGARGGAPGVADWVLLWNSIVRLLGFAAAGWLAAEAGGVTRNLERTVQERTSRLQSEVEEHKETGVRLRETLELFRQVTENITEVFWVTDPAKTRVNYVSRGFETVWGQPRQAVYTAPQTWLNAVYEADRERVTQATYSRQITGDYDEEYRVQRPDGSLCWVHDRAFPVRNEQSEVYRIVGITEDITERKRAEELLEAQRDVGVALSVTSELTQALDRLLATATSLEGIDCGGVYLTAEQTGAIQLQAHVGLSPEFVQRVSHYEAGASETRLIAEGRPLYPICGPGWNTENAFWIGEGLRALAVLPLQHEGKVLGALTLGSHGQEEIPPQARVGLETVAAQAAGAIARIRLEQQILEISDGEQARIGQDIHDGLCQQLIGLAFSANSLQQSLSVQGRPEAAVAGKIVHLLDEAITESRSVCRGLYPVRLETEGLVPALEELARTTTERFNLECVCEAESRRLHCNIATATHLYRIAQEAVNNAVKHSGARCISIRLSGPEGSIELKIKDDGRGLPTAAERHAGMGLHIMDYRARRIGGVLKISGNGNGTVVECRVGARVGM
jgi:PAS domain S-box-containing protein